MKFHTAVDFQDGILKTAEFYNLLPIFIEKDYWVTFVLKNLSQSEWRNRIVFKGGTSLSKAHRCMERFSEDIDLALLHSGMISDHQNNKQIKQAEKVITTGLEYLADHPMEIKRGRNRKTFYAYHNLFKEVQLEESQTPFNWRSTPLQTRFLTKKQVYNRLSGVFWISPVFLIWWPPTNFRNFNFWC